MHTRPPIACLLVLTAAFAWPAAADGPPGKGWSVKKVTVGAFDARTDLQGTLDGFERYVDADTLSFEAYGETISLTVQGKKVRVSIGGAKASKPIARFPAVIHLGPKKDKQRKAVLLTRQGTHWVWTPHWGATLTLGKKQRFLLVDANADGTLWQKAPESDDDEDDEDDEGDPPVDGIVGPHSHTVAPWHGVAWSTTGSWHLVSVKGKVYSKPAVIAPKDKDVTAAFALLNGWRQAAGIAPVGWNAATAKGCRDHATYCQKNNIRTHQQDENNPHYTEAGSEAASTGVLSFAYSTNREAILEQLGTSFHLGSILAPASRQAGMAVVGSNFCANVDGDRSGEGPEGPVSWVWPPHGSTGITRAFNHTGEMPMPVPGQEMNHKHRCGQVVMALVDGDGPYTLTVTTDRGKAIEGHLTTPDAPIKHPGVRSDNMGLVLFVPKNPLPANTRLFAVLTLTSEEHTITRRWHFRTGGQAHLVICHGGGGGGRRRGRR